MLRTLVASAMLAVLFSLSAYADQPTVGQVIDAALLGLSKAQDAIKTSKGPPLRSVTLNLTVIQEDKVSGELKLAPINAKGEASGTNTNKLSFKIPVDAKTLRTPKYISDQYKQRARTIYKSDDRENRRVSDRLAENIIRAIDANAKFAESGTGISLGSYSLTIGISTKVGGQGGIEFGIGAATVSLGGGLSNSYANEFVFAFGEEPKAK